MTFLALLDPIGESTYRSILWKRYFDEKVRAAQGEHLCVKILSCYFRQGINAFDPPLKSGYK